MLSTWDNWERGKLAGRGYAARDAASDAGIVKVWNYWDSCLPAAGSHPLATLVEYPEFDLNRVGFDLTTYPDALAGDWFVLDYVAEKVGSSQVEWFDYALSFDVPKETLSFTHVPSRDFQGNGIVDFADFASLASRWRQPVDPNADPASPHDLDADHLIGPSDLVLFSGFWLDRTDCAAPAEPNAAPAEPNTPAGL